MTLPDGWFSGHDIEAYRALYEHVPDHGYTVEIGVYRGRSLMSVADIIKRKQLCVLAVDLFSQPFLNDFATDRQVRVWETARDFGINENVVLKNTPSVLGAQRQISSSFDLVFIDADHLYESVKADIEAWSPMIRRGGILCGHDYEGGTIGVIEAVVEHFGRQVPKFGSTIWQVEIGRVGD
jgi:hypothetical protein